MTEGKLTSVFSFTTKNLDRVVISHHHKSLLLRGTCKASVGATILIEGLKKTINSLNTAWA